ncbi:Short chain dehydrogenase-like protein 9 [Elsinoe fawcettii]|nr:Short chain dehydrogenase-like protein 9 [Elsinoe fawcettii]
MSSSAKYIVLITGGNVGIGFELARQLLADSTKHILLGSRSLQRGEAAIKELESDKQPGTVELLELDVSQEDSINAAAKLVESKHGRLDALVNNAAIAMPEGTLSQQMQQCFLTNSIGPALMGDAFEPLLKKSIGVPRILNVSSGVGSIAGRMDPSSSIYNMSAIQYRASKSALNMVSADQSVRFGPSGIKVFAYCPGFTVSKLSSMNTAENGARSTAESAEPMVKVIDGARDSEHGGFLHGLPDGQYPW